MTREELDRIIKRKGYSIEGIDHGLSPSLFRSNYEDKTTNTGKVAKLESTTKHATLPEAQVKEKDSRRFLVRITSIRKRLLDEDNLAAKYHIDCCRYAGLIPNDNPEQTKIEVRQVKASRKEVECTIVEIEEI